MMLLTVPSICLLIFVCVTEALFISNEGLTEFFNRKVEIVYIISGNAKFGAHNNEITYNKFKKEICDMIKLTSVQLVEEKTQSAVLFVNSASDIDVIGEMGNISTMQQSLDTYFMRKQEPMEQDPSAIANSIQYAQNYIFSKDSEEKPNKIVFIMVHYELKKDDITEFLQEICNNIITFVVLYPKLNQKCSTVPIQKTTSYINMLLNYTGQLKEKQATCSEEMKQVDFQDAIDTAIEKHKEVLRYCDKNPHLQTLADTGLPIVKCTGFFCPQNDTLWVAVGMLGLLLIPVILFLILQVYKRLLKSANLNSYSFVHEALTHHNQFMTAHSKHLFVSPAFQTTKTTQKAALKRRKSIAEGEMLHTISELGFNKQSAQPTNQTRRASVTAAAAIAKTKLQAHAEATKPSGNRRASTTSAMPTSDRGRRSSMLTIDEQPRRKISAGSVQSKVSGSSSKEEARRRTSGVSKGSSSTTSRRSSTANLLPGNTMVSSSRTAQPYPTGNVSNVPRRKLSLQAGPAPNMDTFKRKTLPKQASVDH